MSPIPARIPSLLTVPLLPAPTVSEYSPQYGSEYGYLTLQDRAVAPSPAVVQERNPQQQYVTLTITLPTDQIYTTTILLGDSVPTAPVPTNPVQQSASQPTISASAQNPNSGGNVAGIVIGVLGSVAVLAGIYYVWLLRARQLHKVSSGTSTITRSSGRKRHKKKKKKKKKSTPKAPLFTFKLKFRKKRKRRSRRSSMSTQGPGAPAPPPAPGPPPAPPPGDAPPPPPPAEE